MNHRVAALALFALAAQGCKEDNITQITLAVTAETKVPEEITGLRVTVTDWRGSVVHDLGYDVEEQTFFPATLALIPRDDESLDKPVDVLVEADIPGSEAGENFVLRHAIVSYAVERSLLLPMPLRMACFDVACNAAESCQGGKCVPAEDATRVVEYEDRLVFPEEGDCFDEVACLESSSPVGVAQGDCTFPIPEGDDVTVSIRWWAAQDRIIALDADDGREGWTRVDAKTGKMSEGVCELLFLEPGIKGNENAAVAAYVSSTCPAKTANLPYCSGGGYGADVAP